MDDEKILIVNKHDKNLGRSRLAALAFSPDGALLAVGGNDASVHIYDESGRLVKTWATHEITAPTIGGVFSLDFRPDGKELVSGGGDSKVHVWDVATWKESAGFGTTNSFPKPIFFSRNHQDLIVVTGGAVRTSFVRIYDLAKKELRIVYQPEDTTELRGDFNLNILDCAISPDRSTLAIGTGGGVVLWDIAAGKQGLVIPGNEFNKRLAFLPDGSGLATSAKQGVQIWDLPSGQRRAYLSPGIDGENIATVFTSDGKHMILAGNVFKPKLHGVLQVWDVAQGQKINEVECQPNGLSCVAIAPDGKRVAVAGTDGTVRLHTLKDLIR